MEIKEAILADLQRVSDLRETGGLTRNLYRQHGSFQTFEIEKAFGTFNEAKAQAGLIHTRHQRQILNAVARHASHDEIRKLNVDRADYGDKYHKPTGRRFQSMVVASDLHDKEMDPFVRRVLVDTIRRLQPDVFCLAGDFLDLPEVGRFSVDPREYDLVGRIQFFHEFLAEVREAAPDTEIVALEGNHEYRLLRYLAEASPAIKVLLSDLHGMTVSSLLGLDKYEVRYVARGDLAAFTKTDMNKEIKKSYETFWDTVLIDHFPEGIRRGLAGFNGHHHKHEVRSFYSELRGPCQWHQLGCVHRRQASYCNGHQWNQGFAVCHVDTQKYQVVQNYIPVADFAEVSGIFYYRTPEEV